MSLSQGCHADFLFVRKYLAHTQGRKKKEKRKNNNKDNARNNISHHEIEVKLKDCWAVFSLSLLMISINLPNFLLILGVSNEHVHSLRTGHLLFEKRNAYEKWTDAKTKSLINICCPDFLIFLIFYFINHFLTKIFSPAKGLDYVSRVLCLAGPMWSCF